MKRICACILVAVLGLAGCPTTPSAVEQANKQLESQGSPFRYIAQGDSGMVMTLMPLPAGPSKANDALFKQTLGAITKEELRKGRSVANLEEVRHLQDGREVWVMKTLGDGGIAYVVSFASPSQPDSNVRMKGPYTYKK
jgi:hypothetical protein